MCVTVLNKDWLFVHSDGMGWDGGGVADVFSASQSVSPSPRLSSASSSSSAVGVLGLKAVNHPSPHSCSSYFCC